jgi:hypothetical protein
MSNTFYSCTLPWTIWPWGIKLTHSDSDMLPECSLEFGVMIVRPTRPYHALWVKVEFELAAFASAKPHRDDEQLADVSGYDIVPRRRDDNSGGRQYRDDAEWLRTGVCPDPSFYFSTDSKWLEAERQSWSERQRTGRPPEDAVHFLLDGRDGYVEILASGFTWRAWPQGRPRLSEVSGDPIMSGKWIDGDAAHGRAASEE